MPKPNYARYAEILLDEIAGNPGSDYEPDTPTFYHQYHRCDCCLEYGTTTFYGVVDEERMITHYCQYCKDEVEYEIEQLQSQPEEYDGMTLEELNRDYYEAVTPRWAMTNKK